GRTARHGEKFLGWFRIDEYEVQSVQFDLYAFPRTHHAFFTVQRVGEDSYLHILATQERANSLISNLRPLLEAEGIAMARCVLDETRIYKVKEKLGLKTIEEIIDGVVPGVKYRATGDLDNPDHIKITKEGTRNSFVFRYGALDKKELVLFRISTSGLTHFRSKVTPKFHIDFITNHLIPLFAYEHLLSTIMPARKIDGVSHAVQIPH
ncbi:MAG: hypothetical protein AAB649_02270, partial [Patescibacteria group bacterium]